MRRIFMGTITVAALFAGFLVLVSSIRSERSVAGATPESGAVQSVESRFVGNYELVSFETFPEEGEVVNRDYVGRILYDEHGNMSAVGMPRDLPERARESGESPRTGFAYFGEFSVNPDEGTVTHHVQGSPVAPDWVGGDQVRYYELEDDILELSLKDSSGRTTATLTWRRF